MTIKDMHYDFKKKLNKVDSQQNRNLLIPEIDWVLNEACEIFVKMIAQPRTKSYLGFEVSQRNIDDIKTIVTHGNCLNVINNIATLPDDYWFFVKGNTRISKGKCTDIKASLKIRQHDDDFESSPFDKSSFEWRVVNATFFEQGLKVYTDDTFSVDKVCIDYIKKIPYIHNAEDFRGGTYKLPSGTVLVGSVNCILPEHTHREIVDLAVAITSGEMQSRGYEINMNKLKLNQLS